MAGDTQVKSAGQLRAIASRPMPLPLDVSKPLSATSMVRVHCDFGALTAVRHNFSAVLRWRTLISRETGSQ
jgi:hypothetical protein